ncbi:hypothetical protein ACJRO7_035784 [Eucalyptus globulus]|uniref:GDSL esterase/lipase n=1 Tax=Eucalyptus globulus TaxID=34317 RepID=A0ABD3J9S1_EUCGL
MSETSSPLLPSLSSRNERNLFRSRAIGMMRAPALADNMPPVFLFGDSTFDMGTNDYITSRARTDFPYDGVDFPNSLARGRFSNGYNSADEMGILPNFTMQSSPIHNHELILLMKQLGYKQSPPLFVALLQYPSNFPSNLLQGANFAPGGAGILNATGFQTYSFAKSIFFISIGSNDIFDHYHYNESAALYNLGGRRFRILSVPPIGCCLSRTTASRSGCLTELNDYIQSFYLTISGSLHDLSSQLQGMMYLLGDAHTMTSTLMDDPLVVGIENIEEACCGNGTPNAEHPCYIVYGPNLCPNHGTYLFWDMFHPTQYAAQKAAVTLIAGGLSFVALVNLSQLAQASV